MGERICPRPRGKDEGGKEMNKLLKSFLKTLIGFLVSTCIGLFIAFLCVAVMEKSLLGIGLLIALMFGVIWYANYRYGN